MDEVTQGYFTHMREQGPLYRGAPPFPFHAQVREVVAPFIYDAIAGNITAQQALDSAAAAAKAEMVKLGYGD
jgi:multiple sugar transport system substrate-binding protein